MGSAAWLGAVVSSMLAGCGAEPLAEDELAVVQQGVTIDRSCEGAVAFPSHEGDQVVNLRAVDATISSYSADDNHGSDPDCMASAAPTGERRCLMRFLFPQPKPNIKVRSAKLTFSASNSGALKYQIQALRKAWLESEVNWNGAWETPGAKASSDRDPARMCVFTGESGRITYELNEHAIAKIQAWMGGTEKSFGFIISTVPVGKGDLTLSSREAGGGLAPELTLVYNTAQPQVHNTLAAPATTLKALAATENFSGQTTCVAKRKEGDIQKCLLRWDVSSIPADRKVASASIELSSGPFTGLGRYAIHAVKKDWVKEQATWNNRTAALSWQSPGAVGATDIASPFASVFVSSPSHTFIVNVDQEYLQKTVQGWITNPTSNKGILAASLGEQQAPAADIASANLHLRVSYF